jgi:hypothetical protein
MYLQQSKNQAGRIYLSFVEGYRVGKKVRHKTVEKIGYLDELEKIYDDPISHFKNIALQRNNDIKAIPKKIEVSLSEKLAPSSSCRKNLGYAVIKAVYEALGLYNFFQYKQRFINSEFNLNSIFSLLIYNRFLFPSSIKHAYETKDIFFESFKFAMEDCYRALDYFDSYSAEIQALLATKTKEMFGRDPNLGYWDVTNYYFEIPYEDADIYDDKGNLVKKGQRKRGPSKDNKKDPIVQMGLLMDSNGIPMAFNTFSGGESEKTNMLPAIRRAKRDLGISRIIVVADRGLNTSDNTALLSGKNDDDMKHNDGYVYGQSILGADSEFKKWVLDQKEYKTDKLIDANGDTIFFTHKSRIYAKKVTLKKPNGTRSLNYEIYQKQMVYYSEKYAKKQRVDRDRIISKAKSLIENPSLYNRSTSYGVAGYIKNISFSKKTGEIVEGKALELDIEKLEEEAKFDGYYAIVTSELELEDLKMRNIYKGLWEIEESFRIIKSEFKARPIFVSNENHVNAHFLICYVTLVIMRVLEHLLNEQYTTKMIRTSLCNYACSYIEQNYYLFDYRDNVLDAFGSMYDWDLTQKYMSRATIKNILKHRKKS